MAFGFFEADGGDASGLILLDDIAGEVDMWLEADSGDANGVIPRTSQADPNFPAEGEVILDVVYGYNNEYTGTYNGSGGLAVPSIEAEDDRDGENATVTITDSDPAAVNTVQISQFGQDGVIGWVDKGSITGDGALVATSLRRGLYVCRVKSYKDGGAVYGIGNIFWVTGARDPAP